MKLVNERFGFLFIARFLVTATVFTASTIVLFSVFQESFALNLGKLFVNALGLIFLFREAWNYAADEVGKDAIQS